jgi:hypothetical protein
MAIATRRQIGPNAFYPVDVFARLERFIGQAGRALYQRLAPVHPRWLSPDWSHWASETALYLPVWGVGGTLNFSHMDSKTHRRP